MPVSFKQWLHSEPGRRLWRVEGDGIRFFTSDAQAHQSALAIGEEKCVRAKFEADYAPCTVRLIDVTEAAPLFHIVENIPHGPVDAAHPPPPPSGFRLSPPALSPIRGNKRHRGDVEHTDTTSDSDHPTTPSRVTKKVKLEVPYQWTDDADLALFREGATTTKFLGIARKLNTTASQCRQRYQHLKVSAVPPSFHWTSERDSTLMQASTEEYARLAAEWNLPPITASYALAKRRQKLLDKEHAPSVPSPQTREVEPQHHPVVHIIDTLAGEDA